MGIESLDNVSGQFLTQPGYELPVSKKEKENSKFIIFVRRSDGRLVPITREQYMKLILEFQRKHQKPEKDEPYELGPKKNDHRVIDVENVSDPIHPGSSAPRAHSCSPELIEEYHDNILYDNGKIDAFRQGKRGDCYFLAAIDSIARTKEGQEILQKNIQKNSNGSYTVTLPGAVAARNHYIKCGQGDKCAITGQYTITAAAVKKAKSMSGKSYAYGDIEVIVLELAMEAFRAEVLQTNKALGKKSQRYIAGQFGPMSESDTLSSGQMYDAVFILTGQKSDLYQAPKSKRRRAKLYKPGEYGYVSDSKALGQKGLCKKADTLVEVNHIYNKDSDLQKMLDKYKGHESEYSITVGVIVGKDGPDGSTKAGGGHALTVTKITDSYVEVVNPWDTNKKERIPRDDFEAMAMSLNVAPISKSRVDNFYADNGISKPNNSGVLNPFSNMYNFMRILFPGLYGLDLA